MLQDKCSHHEQKLKRDLSKRTYVNLLWELRLPGRFLHKLPTALDLPGRGFSGSTESFFPRAFVCLPIWVIVAKKARQYWGLLDSVCYSCKRSQPYGRKITKRKNMPTIWRCLLPIYALKTTPNALLLLLLLQTHQSNQENDKEN